MVQAAVTKTSVSSDHPSNYRAMAMVTTLFFMWGFLTSLNDILVPHLKSIFELNYTRVMLINPPSSALTLSLPFPPAS